jgi:hypothetical protein
MAYIDSSAFQVTTTPIKHYQWVKSIDRLPTKSGMYITEVQIEENGHNYYPVTFNQFDTLDNEWICPSANGTPAKVIEWLDEADSDTKDIVCKFGTFIMEIKNGRDREGFNECKAMNFDQIWDYFLHKRYFR